RIDKRGETCCIQGFRCARRLHAMRPASLHRICVFCREPSSCYDGISQYSSTCPHLQDVSYCPVVTSPVSGLRTTGLRFCGSPLLKSNIPSSDPERPSNEPAPTRSPSKYKSSIRRMIDV